MSIALLSAKTGNRHVSVMKTMAEEFKKQNYHDIYEYPSYFEDCIHGNIILSNYYNSVITLSQMGLCAKFYELFARKRFDLSEEFYQESREKIFELVSKDGLECIISTSHSINNSIIKVLKETKLLEKIPFYIVVTDPFDPIAAGFDVIGATKYFCPTDIVKKILEKSGIESPRIKVIDYPVSARFNKKYSNMEKKLVYERMGLLSNKRTILLNSGALGSTHYFELLKRMLDYKGDCQIIILCGMNETLYKMSCRLQEQNRQTIIKVLSYVDNIDEILQISDLVVTKAGANAFFECLYSETPVIIDGIHGFLYQEQGVVDYLRDHGVGVVLNDSCDLPALVDYFFSNGLIERIKTNIKNLNLRNGTSEIVHTVLSDLCLLKDSS